jgi:hypothetical protein
MTDPADEACGARAPASPHPPERIGPFHPDVLYLGSAVAEEHFGQRWSSWLNARSEGRTTPEATLISGRIYYRGSDLNAWLDRQREVSAGPAGATPQRGRKLNVDDVPAIRAALARGETQREIAHRYGVSEGAIGHIAQGRAWKDA